MDDIHSDAAESILNRLESMVGIATHAAAACHGHRKSNGGQAMTRLTEILSVLCLVRLSDTERNHEVFDVCRARISTWSQ